MKYNELRIDKFGRPCRDLYFMSLCFEVARKSIDPTTKHGCIAVDSDGGFLTSGYNGPPQDYDDENFPITRPEKYLDMVHSEANCIYISQRKRTSLVGSTLYVTGFICRECLKALIQCKISKIIYGPYNSIKSDEYLDSLEILLRNQKIIIERFKYDEALYAFNPRVKEIIEEREVANINFEWNTGE